MTKSFVELISPYVPTDRLHAMAAGRDVPDRQHGAVLLADISGFTPLTERLVNELGPRRGGEELTRHLNVVYGALLDEIARYRGSVVGFSGDAVTCWFDDDDDGRRATACGLRLHGAVPASSSVAIKVSIATGTARRFVVGAPHVIDVVCGSILDRVARGEVLAERGEVIVGVEVVRALGDALTIGRWAEPDRFAVITALANPPSPAGWPVLDPRSLDEHRLAPWLLAPVYERLRSGSEGAYLAELRQAVALFVRFEGLDYDRDAEVGTKLDTFVRWVQGVVERHGGALLQLTTGDKGSYLYVVFGAPIGHEDDSARAAEAALALRSPPPSVFVTHTQIGISRGQLRAGGYGSDQRRTYGVLGDETNVAARLMMKAGAGQILVTDRIVKTAGVHYQFGSLGELVLKGKQHLVPVFELTGRSTMQRRRRTREPMIGRDHDRAALQSVLDRVAAGEAGHSIIIEGDPGIGKTALVGELLDRARKLEFTCAITAGVAIESAVPYHAMRRVFERLFDLDPAMDLTRTREQVATHLPSSLAAYLPLLDVVVPLDLPDTAATAELHGAMRVAQTRRYLVRLLDALAGPRPIVLVIEDANLIDSASWQMIEAARESIDRLLLVLTVRPSRTPPGPLAELATRATTHVLRLAGLSHTEVIDVVARRLGIVAVPPEVSSLVGRIAEGNPFFAEELASALRETGVIEITNDTCRVARSLDALPFPDTIEGVVTSRIDRLPPNELLTLKVASVLGRAFQIAPLTDVFPVVIARREIPQFVAALSRQELATRVEAANETYAFKHAITQDIAYNLMLFEQRRTLHHLLAEWFDTTAAGLDHSLLAVRAYHRTKAIEGLDRPSEQSVRRALDAVMQAGQRATATGATAEAIAYFASARELLDRLPASRDRSTTELDLCTWLGTAYAVSRGPTHASTLAEFARARVLCDELGDRTRLFEALFNQWYSHLTGSEREGALEFSQQLVDLASSDDSMALLARHARGATLISIGEHTDGMALMRSALSIARRSSRESYGSLAHARNPALACHAYLAWASWFLGLPAQALDEAEQALAIATREPHPGNLAQAHCFAALAHRYRREIDQAEHHATRAYAVATEHAIPYWTTVSVAMRAWCAIQRGEIAKGVAWLDELAKRDREAGVFPLVWITVRIDLVHGLTALGRYDEALAVADEAKRHAPVRLLEYGLPELHRVEGELWRTRGDVARAAVCFDAAVALARKHRARSLELRAELDYCRMDPSRRPFLERVYATFTEGLQTADLVDARALLAIDPASTDLDVEGVKTYVLGRMSRELAPELTYHCLEHTRDDVLPAVVELAARAELSPIDTTLLATGALFHDLGFVECRDGHEQVGTRIAREVLPRFGYSDEQIAVVVAIIMATKLPQSPTSLLEQLMADADLDVLGRDDFIDKNDALRQEWASFGLATTRTSWYEDQLAFVRRHRYFTNVANEWRGAGKQRNIAELERRLAAAKAGTT